MTRKEINEWIDDVNNGTGNPNRPPELKAGSEPCSEGIFSLNCEEIGPKNNGELQVINATGRENENENLLGTLTIPTYENENANGKNNNNEAKGK